MTFEEWWMDYGISGKDNEWSARTAWESATKLAHAEYTQIGFCRRLDSFRWSRPFEKGSGIGHQPVFIRQQPNASPKFFEKEQPHE
jgi:hypothetical protein